MSSAVAGHSSNSRPPCPPRQSTAPDSELISITAAAVRDLIFVAVAWDAIRITLALLLSPSWRPAVAVVAAKLVLMALCPWLLLRRGHVRPAAWMLSIGAALITPLYVAMTGGLRSSALVLNGAVIGAAAILLGKPGAVVLGITNLTFLSVLTALHLSGYQFPSLLVEPPWIIYVNSLSAGTLALIPAIRAVNRLRSISAEHRESASQLQAKNHRVAASERRFALAQEVAQAGIIDWDRTSSELYYSPEARAHLGLPLDDGHRPSVEEVLERIHPADRERVHAEIVGALADAREFDAEFRLLLPGQSLRWMTGSVRSIRNESGAPVRLLAVIRDITESKRKEQSLLESEANFRALFDHSPYGALLMDPVDFSIVSFNDTMHLQLGYTRGEFASLNLWDLDDGMTEQQVRALGPASRARPPAEFETRHRSKSGELRDMFIATVSLRLAGRELIYSLSQDITERKRLAQELLASDARLRILADLSGEFWAGDNDPESALSQAMRSLDFGSVDLCTVRFLSPDEQYLEAPELTIGNQGVLSIALVHRLAMKDAYLQQEVVRKREGVLIRSLANENQPGRFHPTQQEINRSLGTHSLLAVPLREGHRTIGVMTIARHRPGLPAFTEQDLAFAQALADRTATAYVAARLTQELRTELEQRRSAEADRDATLGKLKLLTSHLERLREEERKHLAREIHDELGQQLTGLKMHFDHLFRAQLTPGQLASEVATFKKSLEQSIRSVRDIATELRPGILDTLGLIPSLEWLARDFRTKSGIPCNASVSRCHADSSAATIVFRVAQEALTNVARHSDAAHVSLNCFEQDHMIHLEVIDDGKGIRAEDLQKPDRFGLLGMRERAALAGGSVDIASLDSGGTRLLLKLPASPTPGGPDDDVLAG
jgi:PAS domain S-box-containing protein